MWGVGVGVGWVWGGVGVCGWGWGGGGCGGRTAGIVQSVIMDQFDTGTFGCQRSLKRTVMPRYRSNLIRKVETLFDRLPILLVMDRQADRHIDDHTKWTNTYIAKSFL